jgi:hypothetical protein
MEPITYSLKYEQPNSETYYRDVHTFTDEVVLKASDSITPIVTEYMEYLRTYNLEEVREIEEYILELLSFGVLWNSYAGKALSVGYAPFVTMTRMAEWRKKHQRVKPYIDFARGVLTTLFLLPKNSGNHNLLPTLEQVDQVCKWFEATGEFKEQALRFVCWRAFWGTKTERELLKIFYSIDQFTHWFEKRSEGALGKYTQNVERFLQRSDEYYKWREDRIQCSRRRIEYHLNMVGAELMNRALRTEFNETDVKVVLVPGCLRSRSADECEAKRVKEGLICEGCTSQCRVNQLR